MKWNKINSVLRGHWLLLSTVPVSRCFIFYCPINCMRTRLDLRDESMDKSFQSFLQLSSTESATELTPVTTIWGRFNSIKAYFVSHIQLVVPLGKRDKVKLHSGQNVRAYPGFLSTKPTRSIATSLDGMLVHRRLPPAFCILGGERHCESKVSSQEHNRMTTQARTQTQIAPSSVQRTNHKATAWETKNWFYPWM